MLPFDIIGVLKNAVQVVLCRRSRVRDFGVDLSQLCNKKMQTVLVGDQSRHLQFQDMFGGRGLAQDRVDSRAIVQIKRSNKRFSLFRRSHRCPMEINVVTDDLKRDLNARLTGKTGAENFVSVKNFLQCVPESVRGEWAFNPHYACGHERRQASLLQPNALLLLRQSKSGNGVSGHLRERRGLFLSVGPRPSIVPRFRLGFMLLP